MILAKAPPNQDSPVNSNVSELSIIRGHEMLTFLPHFCLPIRQVNTEVPEFLLLKVSLQLPKHHQHVLKIMTCEEGPPLFFVLVVGFQQPFKQSQSSAFSQEDTAAA